MNKHIIDCLKTHYGIEVIALTLLPLGADMDALIYKAHTHDKLSYFVKVKRGNLHDDHATIMTFLRNAGMPHMIPIVQTIQGQSTWRLDDFTLTVFPFIEGQDGLSRDLTDSQWHKLGKAMKQLHNIDVPPSMQSMVRWETYAPQWRQTVRSLFDITPNGDTVALTFLAFIKKHKNTIHRLVDRAEQLAKRAQAQSSPFVLCHADIHGGNVLIDDNGALYIVDWDSPIMAPKERDLMFIGGGVANVWNKPREEALFYKGYGATDVNMTLLAYYRHERIVEDIALYGQQLLLTTQGGLDRMKWYEDCAVQFEPQGVVEIAFQTDGDLTA